jgi:hypothetical protein
LFELVGTIVTGASTPFKMEWLDAHLHEVLAKDFSRMHFFKHLDYTGTHGNSVAARSHSRHPPMGEHLLNSAGRLRRQSLQHIAQVCIGIKPVDLDG